MAWCRFIIFFITGFLSIAVAPQDSRPPPLVTLSIAPKEFVVDPTNIVLDRTTVSAGGPAVTIGGAVVSEDKEEDIFVDRVEVLTGPINTAETTFSNFRSSRSQRGSRNFNTCFDV